MGKSKRKTEGQYVPLPYSSLKSDAWRSLSGPAVRVWLELHTRYNGGNNGSLLLSYAEASEALGIGRATVGRAFSELVDKGLLALEQEGDWCHRRAHEWWLTTKPMQGVRGNTMATNDWHRYRAKTKAGSGMEPSQGSVVPLENPSGAHGSKREPVRRKKGRRFGSGSEH